MQRLELGRAHGLSGWEAPCLLHKSMRDRPVLSVNDIDIMCSFGATDPFVHPGGRGTHSIAQQLPMIQLRADGGIINQGIELCRISLYLTHLAP